MYFTLIQNLKSKMLFDNFVGPRQHVRWNRQTDLFGGFQIDNQFKLGRLLYRQVGGLCAFEDFVHIGSAVVRDAAGVDKLALREDRRHAALYREVCKMCSLRIDDGALQHEDSVSVPLACGSECGLNILGTWYVLVLNLHSERPCSEFRSY